jgi:hypothetical protein
MFEDEMPMWSASAMFESGLIDEETAAAMSEPFGVEPGGAYFSDADLEPVELAA